MIWHILTAVLVVLKLLGYITVSWWLVFLPSIIAFVVVMVLVILTMWAASK